MPQGTARSEFGLRAPGTLQIETRVGAVELISDRFRSRSARPTRGWSRSTRRRTRACCAARSRRTCRRCSCCSGGVSLLVGAIGIANVTLVSVLERVGEIGLRRALGASRRHIASQFLLESTAMGLAGGVIGASLGIFVIVGVSAMQTWTPVLDAWIPLGAPLLGALIGLLSGTYPSIRAASLEPVEALRAGT